MLHTLSDPFPEPHSGDTDGSKPVDASLFAAKEGPAHSSVVGVPSAVPDELATIGLGRPLALSEVVDAIHAVVSHPDATRIKGELFKQILG